jgi:hypothetical protein
VAFDGRDPWCGGRRCPGWRGRGISGLSRIEADARDPILVEDWEWSTRALRRGLRPGVAIQPGRTSRWFSTVATPGAAAAAARAALACFSECTCP